MQVTCGKDRKDLGSLVLKRYEHILVTFTKKQTVLYVSSVFIRKGFPGDTHIVYTFLFLYSGMKAHKRRLKFGASLYTNS